MFKKLSIGVKAAMGFGLILIVMAAMVAFAIRGLHSDSESFTTYRRLASSSVLSGRVQANMLMASRAAKDYLKSRDDKYLEIYDRRFATAQQFALEQQAKMEDVQRSQLSRSLVKQLEQYQSANQQVFQLVRRRDSTLQQTLDPQGIRMRTNLTDIMISANRDEDSEAAYLAGRALERVLLGRLYLFKFLEDSENADADRVRTELGDGFEADLQAFAAAIDDPERKEMLQEFAVARESYLAAFESMVGIVKQRNLLIEQDVLPLDESIAEISERIKLSLKDDQDALGPRVQESNAATIRDVLMASLLAVALAILIAWLFVRTINKSVRALGISEAETERLSREIAAREETERKLATAMKEVKRVNFLSDIALELSRCGYWHIDYSDPDHYYQSERAARILGEPIKPDGRYHLQDEWFSQLLAANEETAALTAERYEAAIEGRYDNYDSTYAYQRRSMALLSGFTPPGRSCAMTMVKFNSCTVFTKTSPYVNRRNKH